MDRHWDQNTKVLGVAGSIPAGGKLFLLNLIYPSLRSNTKLTTLPTFVYYGKTLRRSIEIWIWPVNRKEGHIQILNLTYIHYATFWYRQQLNFVKYSGKLPFRLLTFVHTCSNCWKCSCGVDFAVAMALANFDCFALITILKSIVHLFDCAKL